MKKVNLIILLITIAGMFGTSCNKNEATPDAADIFVGTYSYTSDGGNGTFTVTKTSATVISISESPGIFPQLSADVMGNNLTIQSKVVDGGGTWSGTGSISGKTITLIISQVYASSSSTKTYIGLKP